MAEFPMVGLIGAIPVRPEGNCAALLLLCLSTPEHKWEGITVAQICESGSGYSPYRGWNIERFRPGSPYANPDHHRKDQPSSRPARGPRRALRPDPTRGGAPAAPGRAPRGQCRLEKLGVRAVEAGRSLPHEIRNRGQQALQAEG